MNGRGRRMQPRFVLTKHEEDCCTVSQTRFRNSCSFVHTWYSRKEHACCLSQSCESQRERLGRDSLLVPAVCLFALVNRHLKARNACRSPSSSCVHHVCHLRHLYHRHLRRHLRHEHLSIVSSSEGLSRFWIDPATPPRKITLQSVRFSQKHAASGYLDSAITQY